MPILKIPTVTQVVSKLRIYKGVLEVYSEEQHTLKVLHALGDISKQELETCLADLEADIAQIKAKMASNRIIQRTSTAA